MTVSARRASGGTPRVSVVVATHRRADMLPNAVRSVREQSFGDWELLVVDDNVPGSPEREATLAALSGALDDARVRYVPRASPGGGSAARNSGIEAARGAWVAFLDDDDAWLSDKLERQLAALASAPPDTALVYTGITAVDERGRELWRSLPRPGRRLYPDLLGTNLIGTTSSVLCRRDVLTDIGGFDTELPAAQDRDLYIRVCRDHAAVAVPEALVRFVHHEGERVSKDKRKKYEAAERLLRKYGAEYARFPRQRSRALAHLGRYAWLVREPRRARGHLTAAIAADPRNLEAYRLWAATLLDPRTYKRVRNRPARSVPPGDGEAS